ncbi:zinc finger CCCH domain-containing protein 67-like isoform X3 [Prunus avium]|uniref:Zinc finger CCCH domain-containing protein 67-like isoform X3 n=1 Tax=Prunus avium TaxID=42229 RepID=A0A6P5SG58_PRUAV|nr:zinc finger CCCH domain-containing protein 67-like isoform X3 [Prunus avium]
MWPSAHLLLPAAAAAAPVLYRFYKYLRPEVIRVPQNPPELSDLDLAILEEIRKLGPALLDKILKDPTLLDEFRKIDPAILQEFRKLDPAIIGKILQSCLKDNKEGEEEADRSSCSGRETAKQNENGNEETDGGGGESKNENGVEVEKKVVDEERSRSQHYPVRPGAVEGKTGRKNKKTNQVSKDKMKEREGLAAEKPGQTECKVSKNKMKEREGLAEKPGKTECKVSKNKMKEGEGLAEKPGKTECKVSKNKMKEREGLAEKPGKTECKVSKNKMKEREGLAEKPGKTEFKNYFRSGGRKSGNACALNPRRGEASVAPILENFMGLPIRPGEKDCPSYMQTLSCMYGTKCRFNHPDPTPVGESDPPSGNGNGGPASLRGALSATAARCYAPISLNNAPLYEPIMTPPSQEFPSQNTEWNGYQAPERSMPATPPYVMNHLVTETNTYEQYPQQKQVQEFPERPGQPVCLYFSRAGDCKHKSNCKYHHPKNQTAVPPSCALSDKGLPLRPGQNICTQYSAYGICNSGPACKFNHPSI